MFEKMDKLRSLFIWRTIQCNLFIQLKVNFMKSLIWSLFNLTLLIKIVFLTLKMSRVRI